MEIKQNWYNFDKSNKSAAVYKTGLSKAVPEPVLEVQDQLLSIRQKELQLPELAPETNSTRINVKSNPAVVA